MAILVDYSQVLVSRILADINGKKLDATDTGLMKHMALTSILSLKKKFGRTHGNVVLCLDGKDYWRKQAFPYYKASRKTNREKSGIDWNIIHNVMDEMRDAFRDNFPYKVVQVDGAEGDDVIACLTKWFQTNELAREGMFDSPQPIVIVTNDTDNFQLQKYPNVKQWSVSDKAFIGPSSTPQEYLIEHICTGDSGDGVPNIMSADNCLADGIRQKSFMRARLDEFYKLGIDACANEEERTRYKRNTMMVDYECIPSHINDRIIEAYIQHQPVKSKNRIMNYFMKNKMKLLMDSVNEF